MACITPNSRRVGYIDPIHGPLYMGSHIHQQYRWADLTLKKPISKFKEITNQSNLIFPNI